MSRDLDASIRERLRIGRRLGIQWDRAMAAGDVARAERVLQEIRINTRALTTEVEDRALQGRREGL